MNMKPTDLQIGAYALAKPSMMLIKVAAVHHKKVGYHAVTHKLNWVRMDLLEPIPLTKKILEINGFELRDGFFYHRIDDKPHHYDFKLENGGVFTSEGYTLQCCIYHLTIRYVHELQNALRLCRLDDLADNFKVEE